MDTIWIPYGYHMDTIWIPYGYHMDIIWISYGYHMDITCYLKVLTPFVFKESKMA